MRQTPQGQLSASFAGEIGGPIMEVDRLPGSKTAAISARRAKALAAAVSLALAFSSGARAAEMACRADAVPCCEPAAPAPRGLAESSPAFGVHVWPSSLTQSAEARERLAALKPGHLRLSIGPNWRRQSPLVEGMSDADLDGAVAAGFASVTTNQAMIATMKSVAVDTKAKLHLVVWEPPPLPGEPDLTRADAPKWRAMRHDHVALAARFHVANLKYLAAAGLSIDAIELSNEPDGGWNIKIAPKLYLDLVTAVRAEAARRNVALPQIYGPGASRVRTTRAYFSDPEIGRGILDAVDVVSLHGWDDAAGVDRFAELDLLKQDFARLGKQPELAITEFAIARPNFSDKSEAMNARIRRPDSVALSPFYGAMTIRDAMRLYGSGIGTLIYWEFQDQSWGKGTMGLLASDGAEKPVFKAAEMLSRRLAGGARRIDVGDGGRVGLIRRPGSSDIILANPADEPLDVVFTGALAPKLPEGSALTGCDTGSGRRGVRIPARSVHDVHLPGH